jgi:hypothetical protein
VASLIVRANAPWISPAGSPIPSSVAPWQVPQRLEAIMRPRALLRPEVGWLVGREVDHLLAALPTSGDPDWNSYPESSIL